MRGPISMNPVTTTVVKIQWQLWDGDSLTIQAVTQRVTEEDCELTEIVQLGSVKYYFTGIDTKEKVDKIVKDIEDGTLT
jgi:hypothetical protein